MDTSNLYNEVLNLFSSVVLIDIQNDRVSMLFDKNQIFDKKEVTYEEYIEMLKKIIHPDYVNDYFKKTSLNELQNNDVSIIKYVKLSSNLAFDNYIDIMKVIEDSKIIVLTLHSALNDGQRVSNDDSAKIAADFIIELENVLNNVKNNDSEVTSKIKYIQNLINEMLSKNDTLLKEYENKVTLEVNKTYKSLLIVDDDTLTRNIFKRVFENDYNIIEAKNGAEAVEIIENNIINIKLDHPENIVGVFLDLKMPVMDGFGVLNYLADKRLLNKIPVVIISADDAKETKEQVYSYAIADMIEKPFNFEIIKKRVNTMISMYMKNNLFNEMIKAQDKGLKKIINSYVKAYLIDYENVNNKIAKYAGILLNKYVKDSGLTLDINAILSALKYYDVSLDSVPRSYLENISKLSNEQRNIVINYPNIGEDIITYLSDNLSEVETMYASQIVKMHNERFDGLGFPKGLQKDEIPMYMYLVNIAIEYGNYMLTHDDNEEIINIISSKSASKYDPTAVALLVSLKDELK